MGSNALPISSKCKHLVDRQTSGNTGLRRLHNTSEARALHGLGEQPARLRLVDEAAYIFRCGFAALGGRDGDVLHAPSAVQYSRARHLVGYVTQRRPVGREYVAL